MKHFPGIETAVKKTFDVMANATRRAGFDHLAGMFECPEFRNNMADIFSTEIAIAFSVLAEETRAENFLIKVEEPLETSGKN